LTEVDFSGGGAEKEELGGRRQRLATSVQRKKRITAGGGGPWNRSAGIQGEGTKNYGELEQLWKGGEGRGALTGSPTELGLPGG